MSGFNYEGSGSGRPSPPQDQYVQDVVLPDRLIDLQNIISDLKIKVKLRDHQIKYLEQNIQELEEANKPKISALETENAVAKREIELLNDSLRNCKQEMSKVLQGVYEREYGRGKVDKIIFVLEHKLKNKDADLARMESKHLKLEIKQRELEAIKLELVHQLNEQTKVNDDAEKKIDKLQRQYQELLENDLRMKELDNIKIQNLSDDRGYFRQQVNTNDNIIVTLRDEIKTNLENISTLERRERSWRKCAEALFERLNMEKDLWIKFPGVSTISNWWNVQNTKDVESNWYKFLVARGIITPE
ncbi:hypothetical protein ACHAP3_011100 [Botrytis cinerea]